MGLRGGSKAIPESFEVSEKNDTRGGPRFDLNGIQFLALLYEEIDLQSSCLPIMK